MTRTVEVSLAEARLARWIPGRRLASADAAARFVDGVGFAVLFPADRVDVPSLYEAVAGPDTRAWADGMGPAESLVWDWKDALPAAGHAWSGKLVHRRACVISAELLSLLYPGVGDLDDHRGVELPAESHRIAEALLHGPLPTSALRELVGDRGGYERGVTALQRHLFVTSAGIVEQRAGWPATLVDLTCRVFDVGGGADRAGAARRFLDTVIEAGPGDLARAFGWPPPVARAALAGLVATGVARITPGGAHRVAEPSG